MMKDKILSVTLLPICIEYIIAREKTAKIYIECFFTVSLAMKFKKVSKIKLT